YSIALLLCSRRGISILPRQTKCIVKRLSGFRFVGHGFALLNRVIALVASASISRRSWYCNVSHVVKCDRGLNSATNTRHRENVFISGTGTATFTCRILSPYGAALVW